MGPPRSAPSSLGPRAAGVGAPEREARRSASHGDSRRLTRAYVVNAGGVVVLSAPLICTQGWLGLCVACAPAATPSPSSPETARLLLEASGRGRAHEQSPWGSCLSQSFLKHPGCYSATGYSVSRSPPPWKGRRVPNRPFTLTHQHSLVQAPQPFSDLMSEELCLGPRSAHRTAG